MSNQVTRVLCFGDSLTAGYTRFGAEYQPYRIVLASHLAAAFPHRKFEVWDNGVPGDTVSGGSFLERIEDETASKPIDWVIVLGGTNDLGSGRDAESTFAALREVYDVAFSHDAQVLALTVTECAARSKSLDAERDSLNKLIKGSKSDSLHVYDLHAVIPYHALRETERSLYWDDGLHLTCAGYDLMGEGIALDLIRLLRTQER